MHNTWPFGEAVHTIYGIMLTRFAPSPTGSLHLGHAYSAVQAHGAARRAGGEFHLRIDDIDAGRTRAEHVQSALDDLGWLGLGWDAPPLVQSHRLDAYKSALDRLRGAGLVYPCFCTRADIAASQSAPHGPVGPLYPGTCRRLNPAESADRLVQSPHCWRIDMEAAAARAGTLHWTEDGQGVQTARPQLQGDIVLARKDAPASYHLASTVDDAFLGVTMVVRGADLFAATDIHRLLQALLDLPTPLYRHHPLVLGPDGRRLAKRDQAAGLAELRAAGWDGDALAKDLLMGRLPTGYSLAMP